MQKENIFNRNIVTLNKIRQLLGRKKGDNENWDQVVVSAVEHHSIVCIHTHATETTTEENEEST